MKKRNQIILSILVFIAYRQIVKKKREKMLKMYEVCESLHIFYSVHSFTFSKILDTMLKIC